MRHWLPCAALAPILVSNLAGCFAPAPPTPTETRVPAVSYTVVLEVKPLV